MSGAVLLVLASLGVAALSSMLLWLLPKLFRRRPPSFREQLAALAPRPGRPVGPAGGVAEPTPISSEGARAAPRQPPSEPSPARHEPSPEVPPGTDAHGER